MCQQQCISASPWSFLHCSKWISWCDLYEENYRVQHTCHFSLSNINNNSISFTVELQRCIRRTCWIEQTFVINPHVLQEKHHFSLSKHQKDLTIFDQYSIHPSTWRYLTVWCISISLHGILEFAVKWNRGRHQFVGKCFSLATSTFHDT